VFIKQGAFYVAGLTGPAAGLPCGAASPRMGQEAKGPVSRYVKETIVLRSIMALGLAGLLLGGCASVRVVESEVQTFSTLGVLPAQATFRFERLPSQLVQNKRQDELERVAEQALLQVGLRRNDANAHYNVQLGVRVEREDRVDWNDAWWYGRGFPGPRFGHMSRWPSPWVRSTSWFQREISLTLRDNGTGQVVYETHATQEDAWSDTLNLLPAIFSAALTDFPAGTQGSRQRKVELQPPVR